jgi:hypothetical protein
MPEEVTQVRQIQIQQVSPPAGNQVAPANPISANNNQVAPDNKPPDRRRANSLDDIASASLNARGGAGSIHTRKLSIQTQKLYAERSLGVFSRRNPLRQFCIILTASSSFEKFIMTAIVLNALLMTITDYSCVSVSGIPGEVDCAVFEDTNSTSSFLSGTTINSTNNIIAYFDTVLLLIFVVEMVIKVIALGFVQGNTHYQPYIKDGWNRLDFMVVVGGCIEYIPGVPEVSALRTLRVLRPLRSLNKLPKLKALVEALINAIPQLWNVLMMLFFVFAIWGIFAVQLWGWNGKLHGRCRLTQHPVQIPSGLKFPYDHASLVTSPACLANEAGEALGNSDPKWKEGPYDCIWPMSTETRLCSMAVVDGNNFRCAVGELCASNYYQDGDVSYDRFADFRVLKEDRFTEDLNWGYTDYENFGSACITIFQAITAEGWTDLMYQVMDGYNQTAGVIYFLSLILFGGFFLLNFTLAVVYESFSAATEEAAEKAVKRMFDTLDVNGDGCVTMYELKDVLETHPNLPFTHDELMAALAHTEINAKSEISISELREAFSKGKKTEEMAIVKGMLEQVAFKDWVSRLLQVQSFAHIHTIPDSCLPLSTQIGSYPPQILTICWCKCMNRRWSRLEPLVKHIYFEQFIIGCILANTVTLSLERHNQPDSEKCTVEMINLSLTVIFLMELVVKMCGLGVVDYIIDPWNFFDATIVAISFLELALAPGSACGAPADSDEDTGGSGISALRTFRLFRVFKLITKFKSLRKLLEVIVVMIYQVANLGMLMALFIFIFALLGLQLLAHKLHFDPTTGYAIKFGDPGYSDADIPRSNFDDFTLAAFTIYQILSGEDWNVVMYDCRRAAGFLGVFYIIAVVVIGNFMILNLFLAVLLGGFDSNFTEADDEEDEAVVLLDGSPCRRIERRNADSFVMRKHVIEGPEAGVIVEEGGKAVELRPPGIVSDEMLPPGSVPEESNRNAGSSAEISSRHNNESRSRGPMVHEMIDTGDGGQARGQDDGARVGSLDYEEVFTEPPPAGEGFNYSPKSKGSMDDDDDDDDEEEDEEKKEDEEKEARKRARQARKETEAREKKKAFEDDLDEIELGGAGDSFEAELAVVELVDLDVEAELAAVELVDLGSKMLSFKSGKMLNALGKGQSEFIDKELGLDVAPGAASSENSPSPGHSTATTVVKKKTSRMKMRAKDYPVSTENLPGTAFGIFGPKNRFRVWLSRIVLNPMFDHSVLVLVLISCITLAIDNPLVDPNSGKAKVLKIGDWLLTILFIFEMVGKVIVFGGIAHRKSYLRSGWNQLDFIIVVISLTALLADGSQVGALRVLRAFRAMRPLRMISRNQGMRTIVQALFMSIPGVTNVLCISLIFFLIFAIIGVGFFKGALSHCAPSDAIGRDGFDTLTPLQQDLVTWPKAHASLSAAELAWGMGEYEGTNSKAVCEWLLPKDPQDKLAVSAWQPQLPQSFDNVGTGMLLLFEMSTTEGWVGIAFATVDAVGPDMQPIRDYSRPALLYSVSLIMVMSFFMVNLFIGVVIDNFNALQAANDGRSILLTDEQQRWLAMQKLMLRMSPAAFLNDSRPPPKGMFARWCHSIVVAAPNNTRFETFIMMSIIFNTLLMATRHFQQTLEMTLSIEYLNLVFAFIFTIEAVMKITAMEWRFYQKETWNRFDFIIVIFTDIGILLKFSLGINVAAMATILRVLRIGRVFRLINNLKGLHSLFRALYLTLPSLANISSLLFLLYFIYTILGVQLFAVTQMGEHLNQDANFQSFGRAMLTLVRASTGEFWNGIMYDLADRAPGCQDDVEHNEYICEFRLAPGGQFKGQLPSNGTCELAALGLPTSATRDEYITKAEALECCIEINGCGSPLSYLYFVSFSLLVTFVFINLFVAVILEGFEGEQQLQKDEAEASKSGGVGYTQEDYKALCEKWLEIDKELDWIITLEELKLLACTLKAPLGLGHPSMAEEVRVRRLRVGGVVGGGGGGVNGRGRRSSLLCAAPTAPYSHTRFFRICSISQPRSWISGLHRSMWSQRWTAALQL